MATTDYVDLALPMRTGGTGLPEGNASAPVGAEYNQTDATDGRSAFVKMRGTGPYGWVRKVKCFSPQAFGDIGVGVDGTTAVATAITRATSAGGGAVELEETTHEITAPLVINAPIHFVGPGEVGVIKPHAGFAGTELITYGASGAGAAKQQTKIGGFKLLPNGVSVDGLRIIKAQNLKIEHIWAEGIKYGFFFDNSANVRILNILLESLYTGTCTQGYRFICANPLVTSFDNFTMLNCASESDATSIWAEGYLPTRNRLTLIGCELQNQSVAGIRAKGFRVKLVGSYIETSVPKTVPSINASDNALIECDSATNVGYPVIDATTGATLISDGSPLAGYDWRERHRIGKTDGERDGYTYGPPNWPSGKAGITVQAGMTYRDAVGVLWTCTRSGDSSGVPNLPRYCALEGEIRIPLALASVANGDRVWWPQGDFEVSGVEVLCTTSATGGTYIKLGADGTDTDGFINQTQGAIANLVAGASISARRNSLSNAKLSAPGSRHVIQGAESNGTPAACVRIYKSGTFTGGAIVVVIRGRYLMSGTIPLFGVASITPESADVYAPGGGFRQSIDGWSQVTTVAASQSGVALIDVVSPRGRLMKRAGSLTDIVAGFSSAITAGTATIFAQKSTDGGATWSNLALQVVITTGKTNTNSAVKGAVTFAAGDRIRLALTTDGSFAPTANNLDAGLAFETS